MNDGYKQADKMALMRKIYIDNDGNFPYYYNVRTKMIKILLDML